MYQVNSGFTTTGVSASSLPAWVNAWTVISTITVSSPGIYYASATCDFTGTNTNGAIGVLGVGTSSTTPEFYSGNMGYYMHTAISGIHTATSANTNIYLLLRVDGNYPAGNGQTLAISSNNQLFRVVRVA
jgi:hypothetical protein